MASVIIGVKSRLGLLVGQATDVDGEHLVFEVVGQIKIGEVMPFRVELSGADDTVLGELRIVRLLAGNTGQLQRWVAAITGIDPRYSERFDEWVEDMQAGRSPWRLRKLVTTGVMHGATEKETHTALSRMDARRSRLSKLTADEEGRWDEDTGEIFVHMDALDQQAAPVPSPKPASRAPAPRTTPVSMPPRPASSAGPASSVRPTAAAPGPARTPPPAPAPPARGPLDLDAFDDLVEDTQEVTRDPPSHPMEDDILPSDPFVDTPTRSRIPAILAGEEPSSAEASVVPSGPLIVDADTGEVRSAPALIDVAPPRAFSFRGANGPVLSVAWPDQRSLQQAVVDGLAAGFLALDHDAVAVWHSAPSVQLVTPGGHDLKVQGQLLTRDGPQVLYRLDIGPEALHVLMEEAGAALR
ncbi:MAG: hypothetical protein H6742_08210 [Alphaproteobacteria bacterium]|nr:hypothetical protein [Alphaproteobacteria bacterium]